MASIDVRIHLGVSTTVATRMWCYHGGSGLCDHQHSRASFGFAALYNGSHDKAALKSSSWAEGGSGFACDPPSKGWLEMEDAWRRVHPLAAGAVKLSFKTKESLCSGQLFP